LDVVTFCKFHQRFLRAFFVQNFGTKTTKLGLGSEILAMTPSVFSFFSDVKIAHDDFFISSKYYSPVTCFFTFNICSVIGNLLSSACTLVRMMLLLLLLLLLMMVVVVVVLVMLLLLLPLLL